ncbi:MAG: ribosome biogenesis GTPase Der [Azospirillaceae bacterium]
MSFTVAIIGRPNVGKSTLFNRLVGRRLALVDDRPGVTRDRREGEGRLGTLQFRVIDTAGLEEATGDSLEARMRRQTEQAVREADVVLMMYDARAGITPLDRHFADWLRQVSVPVLVLANKAESRAANAGIYEAYELGLGDPMPVSAEHGTGLGALVDALEAFAPKPAETEAERDAAEPPDPVDASPEATEGPDAEDPNRPITLAIVGRPNVGKSTLMNALLDAERVLTGPEAGITRDAITVDWSWKGRIIHLVDTAGMRRRARVDDKLEKLSVADGLRAVDFAQVVVLVLDADAILDRQDLTIARKVAEEGRALLIAVNKWDAAADKTASLARLRDRLETSLPQIKGVPTVTISALRRRNLDRLMDAVIDLYAVWDRRVSTGQLNRWFQTMMEEHPPPIVGGRRLKLRYITQIKSRPPTFAIWTTRPGEMPDSYLRYLVNGLRERFDLPGVPIRLTLRKGRNPYVREG